MSILDDFDELCTDVKQNCKLCMHPKRMVRTIHPVGQGAFYSEELIDLGHKIHNRVVYDCGSFNSGVLKREISSSFDKDDEIDVLFISHFDSDHINGLEYLKERCKIHRVVMPLISPSDMWFYIFALPESLQQLVLTPQEFFGENTGIIYIKPIEEKADREGGALININTFSQSELVASGVRLCCSSCSDWCYIPFNFDEQERRNTLLSELQKRGIDTAMLKSCDLGYIGSNRKQINEAYKNVCPDGANKTSLIVYSGPSMLTEHNCRFWSGQKCVAASDEIKRSACIYFGDTDLRQGKDASNILRRLDYYIDELRENIGTIQLPHHGAKKNFNYAMLALWEPPKVYFASYGEHNTYAHPSSSVLGFVLYNNVFFGVTEKKSSMLIENIEFQLCSNSI